MNYLKNFYEEVRDRYRLYSYRAPDSQQKPSKFAAFFKAVFSYIFRRPKPAVLSEEQRNRFERGLDTQLTSNYSIEYRPGSIIFRPRGLVRRL